MKTIIKNKSKEKRGFRSGDILEYTSPNDESTKIIVLFHKMEGTTEFSCICLYAEDTGVWIAGEYYSDANSNFFRLYEGTLEISN